MRILPFLLFLSFISTSEAKFKIAIDFEGVLAKRVPIKALKNYPAKDIVKGNHVHMYIRPETAEVLGKILESKEVELVIVNSDHRIDNPDILDFISKFQVNSKPLKDYPVSVYKVADLDKGINLSKIASDLKKTIYLKDSSDKVQMNSLANAMTVGPFDFAFKDYNSHEYVRRQIGSKYPNSFVKSSIRIRFYRSPNQLIFVFSWKKFQFFIFFNTVLSLIRIIIKLGKYFFESQQCALDIHQGNGVFCL